MALNPKIGEFVALAKASGASDTAIAGMLTSRGWPEKDVYESLAADYERQMGVEIPRRGGAGTPAKDAFFYLLIFSTLATWTFGMGWVAFTLIDRWFADRLFSPNYGSYDYDSYSVASALAALLVAFPIYLLVSRTIVLDLKKHPEKLDSPVRKWLTYIALVIAASVFMGDLITALAYLLRGELTSRFLAKAFVVLAISGGVFFYYFGGVRKSDEPYTPGKWSRDAVMGVVSATAAVIVISLGFWYMGAPKTQRTLRADEKRVQDLFQLSGVVTTRWNLRGGHTLPADLNELSGAGVSVADPLTDALYEYHPQAGSQYELCATFAMDSQQQRSQVLRTGAWSHPSGRHCFLLDASRAAPNPSIYFDY
jgi:hypothetical protein